MVLVFTLLGSSLKKEADETLFLELALRGYDRLADILGYYVPFALAINRDEIFAK